MNRAIYVPHGVLFASSSDEAAAAYRRKVREELLEGKAVKVTQAGEVKGANEIAPSQTAITVPPGKLASFYWYENDRTLFEAEKQAMAKYFPQFELGRLDDGRLYWHGKLSQHNLRPGGWWYLQAIYDHNHPHNNTYGGSIKVYAIEPDLDELAGKLDGPIPHTLVDPAKHLYLCTARPQDIRAGEVVTSAASSLSMAAKWIAAFELWMAGDFSTQEFAGHNI